MTTPDSLNPLVHALRAAAQLHFPGGLQQACTTVNNALHVLHPEARRWQGTYNGERHEWARVGPWWVDVTADQFPGGPALLLSQALGPLWAGAETPWQSPLAWPAGKAAEVHAIVRSTQALLARSPA